MHPTPPLTGTPSHRGQLGWWHPCTLPTLWFHPLRALSCTSGLGQWQPCALPVADIHSLHHLLSSFLPTFSFSTLVFFCAFHFVLLSNYYHTNLSLPSTMAPSSDLLASAIKSHFECKTTSTQHHTEATTVPYLTSFLNNTSTSNDDNNPWGCYFLNTNTLSQLSTLAKGSNVCSLPVLSSYLPNPPPLSLRSAHFVVTSRPLSSAPPVLLSCALQKSPRNLDAC